MGVDHQASAGKEFQYTCNIGHSNRIHMYHITLCVLANSHVEGDNLQADEDGWMLQDSSAFL